MELCKSYFNLLKVAIHTNFIAIFKTKNNVETVDAKARTKKILGVVGMVLCVLLVIASLVFAVATFAVGVLETHMEKELVASVLLLVQVIVVFFGAVTTLSNLYFGKDNQLLLSLPIKSSVVFAVKFTVSYINELVISIFAGLPVLLTFGITAAVLGYSLGAWFYILSIISVFLLPILPLLLISLLSIPLMYVMSFLKQRNIAKIIVSVIFALGLFALYCVFLATTAGAQGNPEEVSQGIVLNDGMIKALTLMSKIGIINYSLVQSLFGIKAFVNFIIYLGGLIVIFALSIFLSSLFYRKGMSIVLEENSSSAQKHKNAKSEKSIARSFKKSFIIKEIKTVFGVPQLAISYIMLFIMIPLLVVLFGKFMFKDGLVEDGAPKTIISELFLVGLINYIVTIMSGAANTCAMVGFSFEQKNFAVLKALPIAPKDIVTAKVITSSAVIVIVSLLSAIAYIAISDYHNVIIGLLLFISTALSGSAAVAMELNNDLNKPQFNFGNISELTRNNKRALKPVLVLMGVGLVYLILGIVLSVAGHAMSPVAAYAVYFAVVILIGVLMAFLAFKKLYQDLDKRFEEIEI